MKVFIEFDTDHHSAFIWTGDVDINHNAATHCEAKWLSVELLDMVKRELGVETLTKWDATETDEVAK